MRKQLEGRPIPLGVRMQDQSDPLERPLPFVLHYLREGHALANVLYWLDPKGEMTPTQARDLLNAVVLELAKDSE